MGACMVIVAAHVTVEPGQGESYIAACVNVVERGRSAAGGLDVAVSADLCDPAGSTSTSVGSRKRCWRPIAASPPAPGGTRR